MKRILLVLILLHVATGSLRAQTGSDFWFVAPEVTESGNHDRPIYLKISTTASAAIVTITQPAQPSGTGIGTLTYNIQPFSLVTIDLSQYIDQIESGVITHNVHNDNAVEKKGIHITSTAGISCYYEVKGMDLTNTDPYWGSRIWNSEIFTLKGPDALGTKFYTPFQTTLSNGFDGWAAIHIVATEDNTKVTIVPTKNLVGHSAGIPFDIILNKGETYCGRAVGQAGSDHPGGTLVSSDKPISVTVKDDSVFQNDGSDLIGDQIVPVGTTGTDYIAVKGLLFTNGTGLGDRAIICATHDNTVVTANGVNVGTLSAGQQYDYQVAQASVYIQTSFPSYVFQTSGIGNELAGTLLPPIKCTGSNSASFTRDTDEQFFMNILVKTAYVNNFLLNGSQSSMITSAQFTTVPNTPVPGEWSFAHISFTPAQLVTGNPYTVSNTAGFFHLGVLNGDNTNSSARLGYFSDYKSNAVSLGSDVTICKGQTHQFKIGPGYTNIYWNGVLTNDSNYTTGTGGKITVTAEKPGCVASATANLFADSISKGGSIGKDFSVCSGTNNITLKLTGNVGKVLRWESSTDNFNSVTNIPNTTNTLQLSPLNTGNLPKTTLYHAVVQSGVCNVANSNDLKIQVDPIPTQSSLTSPGQSVCTTTARLTGNTPTIGSGVWTLVSGSGTITNSGQSNSGVTSLGLGTNIFKWTITSGACASTNATYDTIIAKNCPIAADFTTSSDSICGASTIVTFTDASVGATTYSWNFGSGASLTGQVNTKGPHQITYSTTGLKTISLVVRGPGGIDSTKKKVYVNFSPTQSNAGTDQTGASQCGQTRSMLNANLPINGTGTWIIKSGIGGILSDPKSNVSDFVGLAGNAYLLTWQISNPPCAASKSDLNIAFPKSPDVSNAGTDQSGGGLCGQTQTNIKGNKPNVGVGTWTLKSGTGGNIFTPNSDTSTFSGLAGNVYVLTWTISNGPCLGSGSDLNILFPKSTPTADAGTDQTGPALCGITHATLKATKPTVGSGSWSILNNLVGGFENGNSPITEFVGSPGSNYVLAWTITNPPCASSQDTVKVSFAQNPDSANAGASQTICKSSAALGGNKPRAGKGKWELIKGAGIIADVNAFNSNVTDLSLGENVFKWTISTTSCGASSALSTITVDSNTVGGTIAKDTTVCQNSKGFISLFGKIGKVIRWESSTDDFATNLLLENTSDIQRYENLSITTKYRALVQSGTCQQAYSNIVALKIKENPDFKLTTDTLICEGTEYKLKAPSGYTNFRWEDESTEQIHIIMRPGIYKVTAIDKYGCKVSSISNIVGCGDSLYNVITPNGDGLNELFIIRGLVPESELAVYNRWGTLVYYKKDYDNAWDGGNNSDGVYLFIYTKHNGNPKTGYLEILR